MLILGSNSIPNQLISFFKVLFVNFFLQAYVFRGGKTKYKTKQAGANGTAVHANGTANGHANGHAVNGDAKKEN